MKMLNFLLLMSLLITSHMFAQDYFPLHVGDYWVQHADSLQGQYQPWTFRKDIEAIDLIGGEEYFRMKQQKIEDDGSGDSSPWYNWAREDSTGIVFGAFGDTSIVDSATIYDPPILWLPNEIENLGYTWEFDAPEIGGNFSFTVESISESVHVPAGTFNDCIKIALIVINTSGDTTQMNHYYLAQDVGEVLNIGWNWWAENIELKLTEYSVQQVSVDDNNGNGIPSYFRLQQNYPNPFNPVTTISYQFPKSVFVNLSIYNVTGQLVETLVNENVNAGYYLVEWNATGVGSGVYFYRIKAGEYAETKKCLILK